MRIDAASNSPAEAISPTVHTASFGQVESPDELLQILCVFKADLTILRDTRDMNG